MAPVSKASEDLHSVTMDHNINNEKDSEDQLLEALVSVDDELYLDHAMLIYQSLLDRKGWQHTEVTAAHLGFEHNRCFYGLWTWLADTSFSLIVFAEMAEESRLMDEKISRLNACLTARSGPKVYQT